MTRMLTRSFEAAEDKFGIPATMLRFMSVCIFVVFVTVLGFGFRCFGVTGNETIAAQEN